MGKISEFTAEQKLVFDQVGKNDFLRENFYFTGGTALSVFYLQHRYSDDLDFFSEKKFDNKIVLSFIEKLASDFDFTFRSQFKEVVYIFNLNFKNGQKLKVDFGFYPHRRVEKASLKDNVKIDSLLDIAVNKLVSINQRTDVKDFVDLFFLIPKFGIWDLIEGARVKFHMELEPWLLADDFLKIEDFQILPKMIKPLKLDELKKFFRHQAIELAKTVVE